MKAFILAAGKGTRLRPLTETRPKALLEVGKITLLERAINKLKGEGFTDIVVNVHHLAQQIIEFLNARKWEGVKIRISDESDQLLDTGGALKKAWPLFENQSILVYNVDVATALNLRELVKAHKATGALATLAVSRRKSSRYLLFDDKLQLCGIRNEITGQETMQRQVNEPLALAFSGIHIANPEIMHYFPHADVFSLWDIYLKACVSLPVKGFDHTGTFWIDLGKHEDFRRFEEMFGT
ncbi:MAG: nucleotidyltransferase family protein [Bacteroidales bacterium]